MDFSRSRLRATLPRPAAPRPLVALPLAERREAGRHEIRHTRFHGLEIVGFAQAAREPVDAAAARQGNASGCRLRNDSPRRCPASDTSGSAFLSIAIELQHHGIEMPVEQLRAFRRIGELRSRRPRNFSSPRPPSMYEIEVGVQERVERARHRGLSRGIFLVLSSAFMRRSLVTLARRAKTALNSASLSSK